MKTIAKTVALTAFAAGVAGLVGTSPVSAADPVELKLASFTGPKHAMNRGFFTPW